MIYKTFVIAFSPEIVYNGEIRGEGFYFLSQIPMI